MTGKMSEAGSGAAMTTEGAHHSPRKGERYRCRTCGMEIQVTSDCRCNDPEHVQFRCCAQDMQKV
jgi:hypothetical protein